MLESGEAQSMAAIARAEGLSPSRVQRLVILLQLPPEVVEQVDSPIHALPPSITEGVLRKVANIRERKLQLREWQKYISGGSTG